MRRHRRQRDEPWQYFSSSDDNHGRGQDRPSGHISEEHHHHDHHGRRGHNDDDDNNNNNNRQLPHSRSSSSEKKTRTHHRRRDYQNITLSNDDDDTTTTTTATTTSSRSVHHPNRSSSSSSSSARRTMTTFSEAPKNNVAVDDSGLEALVLQLTPTPSELKKRYAAFCAVRETLYNRCGLHLYVFGSQRTGITLPSSDVDCIARTAPLPEDQSQYASTTTTNTTSSSSSSSSSATKTSLPVTNCNQNNNGTVVNQRGRQAPEELNAALKAFRREGTGKFYDIRPIKHAKVPIIKLRHRPTLVEIDICFQDDGLNTSKYLSDAFDECRRRFGQPARALVVLLKAFVAGLDCNDPSQRGVGSFVCSLLVLWFLHNRRLVKKKQSGRMNHNKHKLRRQQQQEGEEEDESENGAEEPHQSSENNESLSLAELFVDMFHFYVDEFDLMENGVDMRSMTSFRKVRCNELHLMNPLDPSRNAASAATRFMDEVLPAMDSLLGKLSLRQCAMRETKSSSSRHYGYAGASSSSSGSSPVYADLALWILLPRKYLFGGEDPLGGDYFESHPHFAGGYTADDGAGGLASKSWLRRWDSLETLCKSVTSEPRVDNEGFYCALSL